MSREDLRGGQSEWSPRTHQVVFKALHGCCCSSGVGMQSGGIFSRSWRTQRTSRTTCVNHGSFDLFGRSGESRPSELASLRRAIGDLRRLLISCWIMDLRRSGVCIRRRGIFEQLDWMVWGYMPVAEPNRDEYHTRSTRDATTASLR